MVVPPLSIDEVIEILGRLDVGEGMKMVLIGGQAVALWGDLLDDYLDGDLDSPVTSVDVDFQGTSADAERAARQLGGTAVVPKKFDDVTPNSGVVRFLDAAGNDRTLDFVDQPFGLNAEDVRKSAQLVELTGAQATVELWVMHPRHCLESRVHNTGLPGRGTELARRQLIASIAQARAFVRLLLEAGESRAALKLNEKLFNFALRDRRAKKLAVDLGIDVFDAVALDPRLPDKFRDVRYPQMKAQVEDRRRVDRAAHDRTGNHVSKGG